MQSHCHVPCDSASGDGRVFDRKLIEGSVLETEESVLEGRRQSPR